MTLEFLISLIKGKPESAGSENSRIVIRKFIPRLTNSISHLIHQYLFLFCIIFVKYYSISLNLMKIIIIEYFVKDMGFLGAILLS